MRCISYFHIFVRCLVRQKQTGHTAVYTTSLRSWIHLQSRCPSSVASQFLPRITRCRAVWHNNMDITYSTHRGTVTDGRCKNAFTSFQPVFINILNALHIPSYKVSRTHAGTRTLVSEPLYWKYSTLIQPNLTSYDIPNSCVKVGNTAGTHTEMWYIKHFHPVGRSRKL